MMYGWIIGLILVVVLIIVLLKGGIFRDSSDFSAVNNSSKSAMETLKKRYADGEINKEEFEEKKAELEK